ncbi:hypothetical protein GI374_03200 [Paracoccus sp. S-4012]|uniref:hypothetical protein n=1 Tax=Paracoccus sp. S-4012 TaxID=2665648 RepID=UPI0012B09496|nr:hypothetical protein [Paracoccus sp. S-4012]MRX49468.1 hypothetical protein [Paracoccus sp. S-4012]
MLVSAASVAADGRIAVEPAGADAALLLVERGAMTARERAAQGIPLAAGMAARLGEPAGRLDVTILAALGYARWIR